MEEFSALFTVSPIDGRYRDKTSDLAKYFSEFALIRYRILVEIEYFIALTEIPLEELKDFDNKGKTNALRDIYFDFDENDAKRVKEIEKTLNHDVKAVEYFLREKFDTLELSEFKEFIHFGLTSQDINNTAIPYALRDAMNNIYHPRIEELKEKLRQKAKDWKDIAMLARTHGQPASPTRLGKEIKVFVERLNEQLAQLEKIPSKAKFGGATGNFNAHHSAYPNINWVHFANEFVKNKLKLERAQTTTQIAHYDNFGAIFDNLKRINTILIDLSRDVWSYISMNYFAQKINTDEVGSSAMPHKVNPIDFENAEGNLGMANAMYAHLAEKLPVSRLQRDLTDSTVIRNIGVPLAHTVIALQSLNKGISKLVVHKEKIDTDLENNWMVISEAIQTILRREGFAEPYEVIKKLTRKNTAIHKKEIHEFIDTLDIREEVKEEIKNITPFNYTGVTL